MKRFMICIECPQGCKLSVEAENGKLLSVSGYKCPRGEKYARQEVEAPARTLTTAVLTKGLELKMLPVRTDKPIPKGKLFEAMDAVKRIVLTSPVRTGDVVASNFLGLGVDLIATRDLKRTNI